MFPLSNKSSKTSMWRSVPPVPESGSEVVAAGEESCMGGRVDHPAHRSIMSQREKLFPASIPTIPHTQGGGGLVWEHHVVLRLVEHGLSLVLLLASGTRACVSDETSTG